MKQLADFTTHHLVTKGIVTESDAPVYAYGFEVMYSSLFTFGSIFVVAACFNFFLETMVFFIAFFPLRIYAGGYHASSRVRCYFLSLAMIVLFCGLVVVVPTQWYSLLELSIAIVAFICVILWAPMIHKNRCTTLENIRYCRIISLSVCTCEIIILLVGQFLFRESNLLFAFGVGLFLAVISLPVARIIE